MIVDRSNNIETWKTVKGFLDGSSKNNGGSGCGVVIKGADADRDKWVTSHMLLPQFTQIKEQSALSQKTEDTHMRTTNIWNM